MSFSPPLFSRSFAIIQPHLHPSFVSSTSPLPPRHSLSPTMSLSFSAVASQLGFSPCLSVSPSPSLLGALHTPRSLALFLAPRCFQVTQYLPASSLQTAHLPFPLLSPSLSLSLPPSFHLSVFLPLNPPRVWPLSGLLSLPSSPCLGLAVSQGLFAPPLLSCVWATACRLLGVGSDATSLATSLSSLLSVPPFPVCAPCLTICLKSCQNYSCPFILDENHILIIFITVK